MRVNEGLEIIISIFAFVYVFAHLFIFVVRFVLIVVSVRVFVFVPVFVFVCVFTWTLLASQPVSCGPDAKDPYMAKPAGMQPASLPA